VTLAPRVLKAQPALLALPAPTVPTVLTVKMALALLQARCSWLRMIAQRA
jgi:hypothetical protein